MGSQNRHNWVTFFTHSLRWEAEGSLGTGKALIAFAQKHSHPKVNYFGVVGSEVLHQHTPGNNFSRRNLKDSLKSNHLGFLKTTSCQLSELYFYWLLLFSEPRGPQGHFFKLSKRTVLQVKVPPLYLWNKNAAGSLASAFMPRRFFKITSSEWAQFTTNKWLRRVLQCSFCVFLKLLKISVVVPTLLEKL